MKLTVTLNQNCVKANKHCLYSNLLKYLFVVFFSLLLHISLSGFLNFKSLLIMH
jgi:hypothetical protein